MIRRTEGQPAPLLSIQDLVTTIATDYGIVRAVNHISFDLQPGRTLGIVGESGSGKSILAKSILNLLPKNADISRNSGIWFDGLELNKMSPKAINGVRGQRIAIIFQDPMSSLNPVMTIGNQIAESLIRHLGMRKKRARNRSVELLKSAGISNPGQRIRQYPHQLSGGMRQRVAMAIALACEPDLLIADEPTTALDVTVQAEILDLLAQRQTQKNMAMILITHDLGVAAGRADDIIVIYAGRIVEQAPADQLFSFMRMPYTQALMNSIPRLENRPHTRLNSIQGRSPDLTNLPRGCSFAPRCPQAQQRCTRQTPPLSSDDRQDHLFACWYPVRGRN
ncbi:ABC transporter ATP-binding protein [Desulfospira joergensenii]|uniref:ABC transporter ATP-binding protein n=1 Tax=Desulfospira joergensenii TaxID=53329 RepID=UPI0003B5D1DE|nr:ABC transporter ATP-binding protein [Desulfospira joergensenii]